MRIVVLPGDGIGREITAATLVVLRAASERYALGIEIEEDIVGHESLGRYGTTVREELLGTVRRADGLILGPTATFDFKEDTKGEINPSMFFRKHLDLFANIRPCRTYDGISASVGAFDLVIARENTEGFYADRNMASGRGEVLVTEDVAISLRRITRKCSERIARQAFDIAMQRHRHVTIVHKANVLKISDGLFVDVCREVAADYPEVDVDDILIDAMMAHVVRNPARFDVILTTNMYGDILSDLTAELAGSIGLGASINAGTDHAMAQAAHGSAPDIAGRDVANPYSLVLSTALLLLWHGQRHDRPAFLEAGRAIEAAVGAAILTGDTTPDIGGSLGTAATGDALADRIAAHAGREPAMASLAP